MTADDDGFVSYSIGLEGQVHVHRSQHGREWVETDVIGDDPGEPVDIEGIYASDGPVSLTNEHGDWMQRADGEWELAWPADFDGEPLANGWLSLRSDQPVDGMWEFGPDGTVVRAWYRPRDGEPIAFDISEMAIPWDLDRDCDAGGAFISSNTVVTSRACGEVREAWILTVDDVPA